MDRNYYSASVKELQQQEKGTLEILEESLSKKLSIEQEIARLWSRIARMTIYIQGTYDYTRRLYLTESGADSGALTLVEPSSEGGLSVVK